MAETMLSMARSMLGAAIRKAASAAAEEMGLLICVRKDIWYVSALPAASCILIKKQYNSAS